MSAVLIETNKNGRIFSSKSAAKSEVTLLKSMKTTNLPKKNAHKTFLYLLLYCTEIPEDTECQFKMS